MKTAMMTLETGVRLVPHPTGGVVQIGTVVANSIGMIAIGTVAIVDRLSYRTRG